ANLFPSVQVGAAKSALAELLSARIDLSKRSVQVNDLAAVNGLNVQRAELAAQNTLLTNDKSKFDGVADTLDGVANQLDDLVTLAGQAAGAVAGDLPGIQAAAEGIISAIRSSLAGFNALFPELTISTSVPASNVPNFAVIEKIFIDSLNFPIPEAGTDITFDVLAPGNPAFPNAQGTGRRAQINGIQTSAGGGTQLTSAVDFNLQGNRGLVNFQFAAGTTQTDIINTINSRTSQTGITAGQRPGVANQVRLYSEFFGPENFISLSELSDPSNELFAQSDTGFNALAAITINGETQNVEADGRVFTFDVGGVQGRIKLYDYISDPAGLVEGADRIPVTARILDGGTNLALSDPDTNLVGFAGLNVESLGLVNGGLDRVNFQTDTFRSIQIVQEARNDINRSIDLAGLLSGAASTRLQANLEQVASIDDSIATTQDIINGIELFSTLNAEARFQSAQSVFAQIASLFPVSTSRLL
ncbi:MAG: hypothetical protein KDB07_04925, partial [Planctomycetes bacterium]|nr:hypothetical protein [Planctomycetota bacterium]